jgi:hypothetical protein
MPKKVSEDIKQKAIDMRLAGATYAEIKAELGVGVSWCKEHLKVMSKEEQERSIKFKVLCMKSKTKNGVSKREIAQELDLYQLQEQQMIQELNNSVRVIRREDTKNIVRPNWMHPKMSILITNKLITTAMHLEDSLNDEMHRLRTELLECCKTEEDKLLVPTLLQLKAAVSSFMTNMTSTRPNTSTKLDNWLNSLHSTAVALDERNIRLQPDTSVQEVDASDFAEIQDFMY